MAADPMTSPAPAPLHVGGDPRPGRMLLHVTWRAFDSIHRLDEVRHLQSTAVAVMERVAGAPGTRAHGMFADIRGGFAVVEVARTRDVMELFAGLRDVAALEVHPVADTADAIAHLRGMMVAEDLIG